MLHPSRERALGRLRRCAEVRPVRSGLVLLHLERRLLLGKDGRLAMVLNLLVVHPRRRSRHRRLTGSRRRRKLTNSRELAVGVENRGAVRESAVVLLLVPELLRMLLMELLLLGRKRVHDPRRPERLSMALHDATMNRVELSVSLALPLTKHRPLPPHLRRMSPENRLLRRRIPIPGPDRVPGSSCASKDNRRPLLSIAMILLPIERHSRPPKRLDLLIPERLLNLSAAVRVPMKNLLLLLECVQPKPVRLVRRRQRWTTTSLADASSEVENVLRMSIELLAGRRRGKDLRLMSSVSDG